MCQGPMCQGIVRCGLAVVLAAFFSHGAGAGGEGWIQDFEQAKTQAKKEKKDLLLDFTGSDWCGWCIRLDKEVFSTDTFKAKAPKQFVLVKLDFPNNKSLVTAEIAAQNATLQEDFGVEGYPTIFLTDAAGRPYGQTGYQEGGPEKYLENLTSLQAVRIERDKFLGEASRAKGTERAKFLDKALSTLDRPLLMPFYADEIDAILELDPDNETGLREKYDEVLAEHEAKGTVRELQQQVNELARSRKWSELQAVLDRYVKDNEGRKRVLHAAYFYKGYAYLNTGNTGDAIAWLKKASEIDPEGPFSATARSFIKQVEDERLKKEAEQKKAEGDKSLGGGGR
ncbi:MAG: thioredoxin family protein [Planctomycetota bacterium]